MFDPCYWKIFWKIGWRSSRGFDFEREIKQKIPGSPLPPGNHKKILENLQLLNLFDDSATRKKNQKIKNLPKSSFFNWLNKESPGTKATILMVQTFKVSLIEFNHHLFRQLEIEKLDCCGEIRVSLRVEND